MAPKRKISKKQEKKKKKKWYSILAPKEFGSAELGESYLATPQELMNRKVRVNPSNLLKTRNSNLRLTLKVTEVKEEKGNTEVIQYEILPNFINRIVRKKKTKIDTSQKLETKDKEKVVIKTVITTRSKVKGGISTALKNEAMKIIEETVKKESFKKLLDSMLSYSLQKQLKDTLKKITPLQTLEIKFFAKK